MFLAVLHNLIGLLVGMVIGFVGRKTNLINDQNAPGLSGLLVKVTLPCLIFMSLQKPFSSELLAQSALVFLIALLMHLAFTCFGFLLVHLLKIKPDSKGVWIFACTFGNVAYMGFPIISAVYGSNALFYTSIANVVYNILCFTMGIYLINMGYDNGYKISPTSILTNNTFIATVMGFICFVFGIRIFEPIGNGLTNIGNMTTPLSMIVVGSILAKTNVKETIGNLSSYIISLVRLIVFPLATFFILRYFIKDTVILGMFVFLAGMPVGAMTSILAADYDTNYVLASKMVFISTILCVVSVPLVSLIL